MRTASMARSSANTTNRALAIASVVLIAVASATATFASRDDKKTGTTPTTPLPATTDGEVVRTPGVDKSWFTRYSEEPTFDFQMGKLACPSMRPYLTLDLCAVADSPHGSFMVTAAEGYWDDSEKFPQVPLDFAVYVHTTQNGPPRAMSVLTGYIDKSYFPGYTDDLSIHLMSIGDRDVIALFYTQGSVDSDETTDTLHLFAMNDTGAPEVIAVIEGYDMVFGSNKNAVVVATSRNGVTSDKWSTVFSISRSSNGSWMESVSTKKNDGKLLGDATTPVAIDKYSFPWPDEASYSGDRA